MMYETRTTCRSCDSANWKQVLSLGQTPLADRLLTEAMLQEDEPHFPLNIYFCPDCGLMQIAETVSPEKLFCEDYPYYSSFSPALLKHNRENALELIERQKLNKDSLVIELASNDGYMLKNFKEQGIPVLGIDPADGPAKVAQEAGIETLCTFFTVELARKLRDEGRQADVMVANNVLAHVPDTNGFVKGISILLKDDGVMSIEVPYARDLIDHCEFDTIYHEHLCYFSVTALNHLFNRHGLYINDIRHVPIHGGSLRVFVGHKPVTGPAAQKMLDDEKQAGVDQFGFYEHFAHRVEGVKHDLHKMLSDLKAEEKTIAAYGAAAKGATLINYINISPDLVDFVVDRNTYKHGKYMPGMHIPVHPCEKLLSEKPDYVLILAWNFAEEIMQQQEEYLKGGGSFIVPVPQPRIVRPEEILAS